MQEKDKTRRKVLIGLTSAVGLSGLPFAATPFIAAWNPSAKAKAAGAAVKLDVSKMQYGQQIQVSWRKQPVFIVRHTKESIASLDLALPKLADPNSDQIEEPYRGLNPSRSKNPEYSVFSGVCTHLGCVPLYKPKMGELDSTWQGGFFCPCLGSKFDLSGRVFKGMPAGTNLEVPPYYFANDTKLIVGEDRSS